MKNRLNFLTPYLFLLPALLVLAVTVFFPAARAFYFSFTSYDLIQPPQWVGLKNFEKMLGDRLFWQSFLNTIFYLIGAVPILVFAPLGLAILVNQKLRLINWFRAAYYAPVVISMVVAGIAWKWIYAENGLLNQWGSLAWESIFGKSFNSPFPIPWLTSPNLALFSVIAVTIWKGLGYYMVIYLAGLQSIAGELYEAAELDGCDGWRRHWEITLPLMKPYLVLVGVISAISATKVFEEVYIMTQGGPRNSSKTIVYYLFERGFEDLEIGYACSIGLVLFLMILGLSVWRLSMERSPFL
ncbi:MAG: sugar ABC transporter permease [Cyanobacteriota bacterium]|nr:sugar ABC transporter permease [Cyanobacteriota bacterium]